MDLETMTPLDTLTPDCVKYLKSLKSNSTKVSEIINNNDPIVYKAIEDGNEFTSLKRAFKKLTNYLKFSGIKNINKKAISRASIVQKFYILPRDFSLANGELGPTMKLRRPIIVKMYSSVIDELYKDSNNNEQ
jgi:long-chain-fatty-acid--CoA ligase ACSBG